MSEYAQQVILAVEEVGINWNELFTPPFSWGEVAKLLASAADVIEYTAEIPKDEKEKVFGEVFDYYDEKYGIISFLDRAIDLPPWLEPLDRPLIAWIIKEVGLKFALSLLQEYVWGE